MSHRTFEALVAEAESAPIRGWDFSWLDGRATEERPSWGYSSLVAERIASVRTMLDLQSGGGEMLSGLPAFPPLAVAGEGWAPNLSLAAQRLGPRGVHVVGADTEEPSFPFRDGVFDLVTSRHPVSNCWPEIHRVLRRGGTFLSQQVGPHSVGELTEFLMGPQPRASGRDPALARRDAERAGLRVIRLDSERLRCTFDDIGAVVYFLRLVIWIVPDFSVARYRERLRALHEMIRAEGPFVAHSARFLIEAVRER